jgi:hypothetical protein
MSSNRCKRLREEYKELRLASKSQKKRLERLLQEQKKIDGVQDDESDMVLSEDSALSDDS